MIESDTDHDLALVIEMKASDSQDGEEEPYHKAEEQEPYHRPQEQEPYHFGEDGNGLTDAETTYPSVKRRRPVVLCRRLGIIVLVAAVNGLLLASVLISSVSLYELSGATLSERAAKMTPACSDPSKVCAAGNVDVRRPSSPVSRAAAPFTYVVASDAQLDWFDGESPSLGRRNAPVPCDEGDSCGTCTGLAEDGGHPARKERGGHFFGARAPLFHAEVCRAGPAGGGSAEGRGGGR